MDARERGDRLLERPAALDPHNPAASNLQQKVTTPCGGAVMGGPVHGTLDVAQQDQHRRWMDTGALR
jgi:hypothetical protein